MDIEKVAAEINSDTARQVKIVFAALLKDIVAEWNGWQQRHPDHIGVSWEAGRQQLSDYARKHGVNLNT